MITQSIKEALEVHKTAVLRCKEVEDEMYEVLFSATSSKQDFYDADKAWHIAKQSVQVAHDRYVRLLIEEAN